MASRLSQTLCYIKYDSRLLGDKPQSRPGLISCEQWWSNLCSHILFSNKSFSLRKRPGECWQWTRFVPVWSTTAFFCPKIICQQCSATITYLKINRPRPHSAVSACAAQSSCWALMWQLYQAEKTNVHFLAPGKALIDVTWPCTLWPQHHKIAWAHRCVCLICSAL